MMLFPMLKTLTIHINYLVENNQILTSVRLIKIKMQILAHKLPKNPIFDKKI